MRYKQNYRQVISRLGDLYNQAGRDRIYAKLSIPNPYLEDYARENTDGPVQRPDIAERARFWDEVLSIYTDLEDDSIPSSYLSELDQGLYAGLLGAPMHYIRHAGTGWISSMVKPFIDDLKEAETLSFDENAPLFRDYIEQMKIFKRQALGKFGVSHFICLDGVNFMYELRGATRSYYDLVDYPEQVRRILEFSTRLNIRVQNAYFATVGLFEGGTVSNVGQWLPGKVVSESVDAFHLASPELFEEWGQEVVQNLFDHFDGGIIHLHTNGHHLLPVIYKLRGLKCIVFLDEDFAAPCYRKLNELAALCGPVPMALRIPYEVFTAKLDSGELPPNTFYEVTGVPDLGTANRLMVEVRKYKTKSA